MTEGELPALASIASRGAVAGLETGADPLHESTWPTIHTGCGPGIHGTYNWRCLRPGTYSLLVSPGRSYRRPWWWLAARTADGNPPTVLLVDVPGSSVQPQRGVTAVQGWGERGGWRSASSPAGLLGEIESRFGRYPRWVDLRHRGSASSQRRLVGTLERMAGTRTRLNLWLMESRPWDACMTCYWEPHNAGHAFQRFLDPESWAYEEALAGEVGDGLLRVYQAVDRGLADLIEAAGPSANVVVFSRMGMRRNGSGGQLLEQLLVGLGHQAPAEGSSRLRPQALARSAIPARVRRRLERCLSPDRREALMDTGFRSSIDWSRTRAFAESEPGMTAIRINLVGREPAGLVSPGAEYDALCDEIEAELWKLRVSSSGAPAVEEVLRRNDWISGPHAGHFPDLVVRWHDRELLDSVDHPQVGPLTEPRGDIPASEHTREGILLAAGPSITEGARPQRGNLTDLAPTLLSLLGAATPEDMEGRPLSELLADGGECATVSIDWSDDPWAATP